VLNLLVLVIVISSGHLTACTVACVLVFCVVWVFYFYNTLLLNEMMLSSHASSGKKIQNLSYYFNDMLKVTEGKM